MANLINFSNPMNNNDDLIKSDKYKIELDRKFTEKHIIYNIIATDNQSQPKKVMGQVRLPRKDGDSAFRAIVFSIAEAVNSRKYKRHIQRTDRIIERNKQLKKQLLSDKNELRHLGYLPFMKMPKKIF